MVDAMGPSMDDAMWRPNIEHCTPRKAKKKSKSERWDFCTDRERVGDFVVACSPVIMVYCDTLALWQRLCLSRLVEVRNTRQWRAKEKQHDASV